MKKFIFVTNRFAVQYRGMYVLVQHFMNCQSYGELAFTLPDTTIERLINMACVELCESAHTNTDSHLVSEPIL